MYINNESIASTIKEVVTINKLRKEKRNIYKVCKVCNIIIMENIKIKEGEGFSFETSDGKVFTITETKNGEITVDCQLSGLTIFCWKGSKFNELLHLEDVSLNLRKGQPIKKFYELEEYFEQN